MVIGVCVIHTVTWYLVYISSIISALVQACPISPFLTTVVLVLQHWGPQRDPCICSCDNQLNPYWPPVRISAYTNQSRVSHSVRMRENSA